MRHQEHQSGFGAIEILLVVLVVTVLVGIGLVLYRQHHPAVVTKAARSTQAITQLQHSAASQTQPTATYLTIKEWAVRLPLSVPIHDAYYVVGKGSSDGPGGIPTTIWLGLASFKGSSCNPANNDIGERGALGAILRLSPTESDPVSHQLLTAEYPNGATIGGHYYAYQSWAKDNPCASLDTLKPIDAAFAVAARGVVAIKN